MNQRDIKDENSTHDNRKYVNSSHSTIKRENNHIKLNNVPNGQTIKPSSAQKNMHRSSLKHRPDRQTSIPSEVVETGRLSIGRVSFAHDGKIRQESAIFSPLQIDSNEKNRKSANFAKKARELQYAEKTYFKDHARDVEPPDE